MIDASYDLLVLGAGPAGFIAARAAAFFGKCVAIVERSHLVGGAVAHTGTLPSKTLRETAIAISGIRARKLYGVDLSLRRELTATDLMRRQGEVAATADRTIHDVIRDFDIDLHCGTARFADPHTIIVDPPATGGDAKALRGEKIVIAIGSSPLRPKEFPFEHPRVHDSDEVLQIECLPKSLAIVGGGVIGSEYACTFAALGIPVHLIDGRKVLMPFLDSELSEALAAAMTRLGITFHWKQRVTRCDAPVRGDLTLTLSDGELKIDSVLVAAGRSGNTQAVDLSAAGIAPTERGLIAVDPHFRTNVPHIYAVGDVIGFPALASTSMEQARVAVCHAFDQAAYKSEVSPILPYGVYTIPEVSTVGETERSLIEAKVDYIVGRAPYAMNPRGVIVGDEAGFLKLLFRKPDMKLLGVHVIGEQATELVGIGVLALQCEADLDTFTRTCFNYPTLSDLYKTAAINALTQVIRGS